MRPLLSHVHDTDISSSSPTTSSEAKEHSKQVLDNDLNGGDVPSASSKSDDQKNPNNVAGGLKATISNPKTSDEAKESAKERLNQMS